MGPEIRNLLQMKLQQTGWTQKRLAAELGVGETVLSRWLSATPPQPEPENCAKLARILDVPLEEMLQLAGYALDPDTFTTTDYDRADPDWDHFQQGLRQVFADVPREHWWPTLAAINALLMALRGAAPGPNATYTNYFALDPPLLDFLATLAETANRGISPV